MQGKWFIFSILNVESLILINISSITYLFLNIFRELLTDLTTRLNELTEDHQRKSQALSLDNKCMGVREKLPSHDFQVSNQCERNMKLTGTLRNASRYLENSTVVK